MAHYSPILCVVGARPNFMKMAAILPALQSGPSPLPVRLIHTGQHYDEAMKASFFRQLQIPEPDVDLEVGSGSHAQQTAQIMQRFEPVIDREKPEAVLVVGDVNSTLACSLVAVKKRIPVIHVEAGLRSFDRSMPEEINRILTDRISDLLFTTERQAKIHLTQEGVVPKRVHFVGNVMIDTLRRILPQAPSSAEVLAREVPHITDFPREPGSYALLTLHRPSNVDDPGVLEKLLMTMRDVSRRVPIIFPVHPRTALRIEQADLGFMLGGGLQRRGPTGRILQLPPLGYVEMLGLMAHARVVLTDSGGIQEETTALGVPCLTLRENTERPITVAEGTNTVVGQDGDRILGELDSILAGKGKAGRVPELWDGQAAQRIARVIKQRFGR
ncbi:MAG: UDP-N-acetylglucosamine 2-epimerase (non-hydrolyzing) [Magnetococcales bacterium]|nr:UDP-N-acetylglucosamine 2-epimerase (non-hydrolyzing) [Magnetococcales bacterium]